MKHLTLVQICASKAYLECCITKIEIVRRFHIDRSAVYRELRRDSRTIDSYNPDFAQEVADSVIDILQYKDIEEYITGNKIRT